MHLSLNDVDMAVANGGDTVSYLRVTSRAVHITVPAIEDMVVDDGGDTST